MLKRWEYKWNGTYQEVQKEGGIYLQSWSLCWKVKIWVWKKFGYQKAIKEKEQDCELSKREPETNNNRTISSTGGIYGNDFILYCNILFCMFFECKTIVVVLYENYYTLLYILWHCFEMSCAID